jgi:NAD(P)-dependent dehydrogenase (short-subunit alcohol dehydrogenase family)
MSNVWFITGATRGLGAEIAKAALAAGNQVVATGRNPDAVTKALGASPNLLVTALDVSHEDQIQTAVQAAVERFGCIKVLVNNAGYGQLGVFEETTLPQFVLNTKRTSSV